MGRDGVIDRLREAHDAGLPVLVIGSRGSGKTRLVQELPARLGRHAGTVWVIDDVDALDGQEAADVARRLREHSGAAVLTAVRRDAVPRAVRSAIEHGVVIDLPPLDVLAVERLLTSALGPVSGLLTETVAGQAAGNPGLATRIIADLQSSGRLVAVDGIIDLGPGSDVGPELLALARHVLDSLENTHREALLALAACGPIRAELLARLHPPQVWAEVEDGGWIRRIEDPEEHREIVVFTEPIIGQAIGALAPFGHREAVDGALLQHARGAGLLGVIGTHRALAQASESFSPAVLLSAAHAARRVYDFEQAVELAGRVERHRDATELDLAAAASLRGFVWRYRWQHDDAVAEYDDVETLTRAALEEQTEAVNLWTEGRCERAGIRHFLADDPAGAIDILDAGTQIVDDLASRATRPVLRSALRRSANDLRAHRLLHLSWSGRHREFLTEVAGFRARSTELQTRLRAASVIGEGITGRPRTAYRRAVRFYVGGMVTGASRTWAAEEMGLATLLVSAQHHGPASVIKDITEHASGRQLDPFAPYRGLMVRLLMSHVAFLTGDAEEALAYAETARATMHTHDPGGARRMAAFARAQALALVGRGREARRELAAAQSMPLLAAAFNRGAEARAEFVVRFCTEEAGEVVVDLRREADVLIGEGLYGVAVELLHFGVRFADESSARHVLELRSEIAGGAWELAIEHAEVVLDADPARCLALATRAGELGLNDVAAELCALGERQAESAGLPGVAETCRRRYAVALAMVRAPGWPLLGGPTAALTRRELQIARRASTGVSAKQMAAEFHLSRRTVEGHLARIYTKLGISHRRDLSL